MSVFCVKGDHFELDGKPFQIISGSIHYFRTVPDCWEDRLRKLKACGFNTVETYLPWNLHEPEEGRFCFDGIADVERFLSLADRIGLKVIVRPSQYICAEWEFGGFPAWLLKDRNMTLRCADPRYLEKVDEYFRVLVPKLAKYQCTVGGPIILCQIENEYGSYGNDKDYLRFLESKFREYGMDIMLFTSDGASDLMLRGGTLPHIFKTANFGSKPIPAFEKLREYQHDGPCMCAEYWNGWFDHWGEEHHIRDPKDAVDTFKQMLDAGASVNFYMFCGGTSFGWMNGANCPSEKEYQPTITSYDYCAPLTEEGNLTPKYELLKELLAPYRKGEDLPVRAVAPTAAYGEVRMTEALSVVENPDAIGKKFASPAPLPMEQYGQNFGMILYRTHIPGPYASAHTLKLKGVHDRAHVFVNGKKVGTVYRNDETDDVIAELPLADNTLDILVENMGRINYGPWLRDEKGITEGVFLDYQHLFGWEVWTMEPDDPAALPFAPVADPGKTADTPAFWHGTFPVNGTPADTYLRTVGFEHGQAWINGFNLGRYWNSKGPQQTLYIPASLLREGKNEITVLEFDSVTDPVIRLEDHSDLG